MRILFIAFVIMSLNSYSWGENTGPSVKDSDYIVGMLEHTKDDHVGSDFYHTVRVLFKKVGTEWRAFDYECSLPECLTAIAKKYPSEVSWTIAFDGKNLGEVRSHTPEKFKNYAGIGRQIIDKGAKVPTIGGLTAEFSGWITTELYRPLVAISKPNFKDPEAWKLLKLKDDPRLTKIKTQFKKTHPKCECSGFDDSEPRCQNVNYKDDRIKVTKAFQSMQKSLLVTVNLNCGGRYPDINEVYLISTKGDLTSLGTNLTPIDAGDYDSDGHSEFVFYTSGYNRGGYTMYYDNFNKKAEVIWSYH